MTKLSAFSALGFRDFRLLWVGSLLHSIGMWMQQFGLGWLVVQLAVADGRSELAPLYIGIIAVSRAIPGFLFTLFAGALADRIDRRKLLVATNCGAAAVTACLALLTIGGLITLPLVFVLSFCSASFMSFDGPTRQAIMTRLVPQESIISAVGLNSSAMNVATIIGPLVGGLLIIPWGVGGLMLVNAISYFPIVVALVLIRTSLRNQEPRRRESFKASIADGLSYSWREPVIRWSMVLFFVAMSFGRPYQQLLPAVAHNTLGVGATELSWLLTASGLGALGGSFTVASLGGSKRRGTLMAGAGALFGVCLFIFAEQRSLGPALLTIAATSLSSICVSSLCAAIHQTVPPDEFRGRVLSVGMMFAMTGMQLGQLALGSLGAVIGVNNALSIGGVIVFGTGLFVLLRVPEIATLGAVGARPRSVAATASGGD